MFWSFKFLLVINQYKTKTTGKNSAKLRELNSIYLQLIQLALTFKLYSQSGAKYNYKNIKIVLVNTL